MNKNVETLNETQNHKLGISDVMYSVIRCYVITNIKIYKMEEEHKYRLKVMIIGISLCTILTCVLWYFNSNITYSTNSEPNDEPGLGSVIWIIIFYYFYKIRIKPYI